MSSPKMFQKGAFKLESNSSTGWGGNKQTFSSEEEAGFPWIEFGNSLNTETKENESVLDRAFKSTPRKVKELPENSLSSYLYFGQLRNFLYWIFGYENDPNEVCACLVTASSDPCSSSTVGEEFLDGSLGTFYYVRSEKNTDSTYLIILEPGTPSSVPDGTEMTGGTNGDTFTPDSVNSETLYEHIMELDSRGRQMRTLTSSEYSALVDFGSTDKKTLQATLVKKMENYDLLYKNSMSKSFSFSMSPGDIMKVSSEYVAHSEERVTTDRPSDDYVLPSALDTLDNAVAHYQSKMEIGADEDSLVEIGIGDFSLDAENPLNMEQSTLSGLSIDEPNLSSWYNISSSSTIQRHSAETYQNIRDNWTDVVARLSAWYGFKVVKLVIEEAKISQAGPDDGDIAKEPLNLEIGYASTSNWTDWNAGQISSIDPSQKSPIKLVIRDTDSNNSMNVDIS